MTLANNFFKYSFIESKLLTKCMAELAQRKKDVKFLRIFATNCIENYPDRNVPTIIIYHEKVCQKQIIGLGLFGGKRMCVDG